MVRGVLIDPRDRLVRVRYDLDRDLFGEVFLIEVLFGRFADGGHIFARLLIPDDLYVPLKQGQQELIEFFARKFVVHDKALARIAYAGALRLCVDEQVARHVEVGRLFHIDMTVPRSRFDDGDGRVLHHRTNEFRPAARNEHVDDALLPHERTRALVRDVLDKLNKFGVESARPNGILHDADNGGIGRIGVLASAQDNGVSALQAQRDGIRRDVGPRFIDDPHDAEGNADTGDVQPARRGVMFDDLAYGTGKAHKLAKSLRNVCDARLVEHETVAELLPARTRRDVLLIRLDDLRGMGDKRFRGKREHFIFLRLRRIRRRTRVFLGKLTGFGNRHRAPSRFP